MLPTAAVPALAGMAAVVCLAPQAQAEPAPAHAAVRTAVTAEPATVADADAGMSTAHLLAVIRQSRGHAQKAQPDHYTIRSGDSLSKIAGKVYHKQNAWPVLYWANRDKIQWANIISTGQVLKVPGLPAKIPAAPGQLAPAPPPPPPAPAPVAATSYAPVQATAAVSGGTYSGGGGFQSCVIARESGGNAQVMNSSGHYGLYQFSASTWQAYGGSAADFGHASVAEQNQVFNNAIAQGGQSNWSPYDGC
ncbi:MAG TPA: transglycosylase family protein [Streptosporangiaceae bacterium]|nr:transglycosylase family protein [Streptosporangiaceae bacterium]